MVAFFIHGFFIQSFVDNKIIERLLNVSSCKDQSSPSNTNSSL
ncbi:hypothetical protein Lalb_Chr15g0086721 [Lupinus albus]|uniref:Uncharacterized protein n=1 Tax=Lupinus albus TaxID=3870 RepID=A0A6A4PDZ8_LUPAL|nr:hypothetical protein Lalb_Chr15g0086721 [Lupinus albus]